MVTNPIFGMYAIPAMLSKVIFGWLVEKKLDPRMAVFISLGLQAAGLLLITMTESPLQLALVIALFGFGGGAGLPMSNILFRITFTQRSFGTSRGLSQPFIFAFQVYTLNKTKVTSYIVANVFSINKLN